MYVLFADTYMYSSIFSTTKQNQFFFINRHSYSNDECRLDARLVNNNDVIRTLTSEICTNYFFFRNWSENSISRKKLLFFRHHLQFMKKTAQQSVISNGENTVFNTVAF